MIANSAKDREGLQAIGKIVALTIAEMKKAARPGMTTRELDEIGAAVLHRHGAKSAPQVTYRFPGYTCISVNHEVAHGIPGDRLLSAGDLVNVDVSAELGGYYADSGHSFVLDPVHPHLQKLCDDTYEAMMKVISSLKAGTRINMIGKIMETEAQKGGYKIIKNLCSHGIGKSLHEYPHQILPFYDSKDKAVLREGLVITIEPFFSTGAEYVEEQSDGWTLKVPDQSFVAQHEHTIMITKDTPVIFTNRSARKKAAP